MKKRLDLILLERGLFPSREQARSAIMTGRVSVRGRRETKAGTLVNEDEQAIAISGADCPYVSRGGWKLARAIEDFALDLCGLTLIDVGASTGGFTDCALQHGAARVYAVDVGYGQLAWSLRQDERVVVLEKTNARYLRQEQVPEKVDLVTADVSFISLKKLVPPLSGFLKEDGGFLLLIKPQFEAGRQYVGKKGVVRDPTVHIQVITELIDFCATRGFNAQNLTYSPLRGPEGNREYLVYLRRKKVKIFAEEIAAVVEEAFAKL